MQLSRAAETAFILVGGGLTFVSWEILSGHKKFYSNVLMPLTQKFISAESAHNLGIKLLSKGLVPPGLNKVDDPSLKVNLWGKEFNNPIGLAAGFDKHAEAMTGLKKIGFGFIEVGSITPLPQDGNECPRVFRLPEDKAVINRYGFNSCGHDVAATRLKKYTDQYSNSSLILGINLGKNKESKQANDDYVKGVQHLGKFADYIVINVSSPNTPGLRNLQGKVALNELCRAVINERNKLPNLPPVLVKVSPDLKNQDKEDISQVVINTNIDGLIVSNTTISRDESLISTNQNEKGGLSGRPLKSKSTNLIKEFYKLTNGSIPIIGVGGIESGEDAYEKFLAGASLVQLYTAFTYHGPPLINSIKCELVDLLKKDGYENIQDVIGKAVEKETESVEKETESVEVTLQAAT